MKITTYDPVTVFTKEYENNISYIRISQFALDTKDYLADYLENLDSKYDKVVLDLRDNPGGYVNSVKEVADLFLTKNKLVMATKDKHGNVENIKTESDFHYLFDKIYILDQLSH